MFGSAFTSAYMIFNNHNQITTVVKLLQKIGMHVLLLFKVVIIRLISHVSTLNSDQLRNLNITQKNIFCEKWDMTGVMGVKSIKLG